MICLALQEGGTAEFDSRRAGRGQGLARWIEISAGCLPVLGRARRRQLLPGYLAGASFTDYRCSPPTPHHTTPPPPPPPRRILVQRPSTTPLPPVPGLQLLRRAVLLFTLSAPPTPSLLRAPPPRRGSTRHARPGIVGISRTDTHPLQEREPTTLHTIDSLSTVVVSY